VKIYRGLPQDAGPEVGRLAKSSVADVDWPFLVALIAIFVCFIFIILAVFCIRRHRRPRTPSIEEDVSPSAFCPIHTADADATQLSSYSTVELHRVGVAAAVCIEFTTGSRRLPTGAFTPLITQLDFTVDRFVQTRRDCRQPVANSMHTADAKLSRVVSASAVCWAYGIRNSVNESQKSEQICQQRS